MYKVDCRVIVDAVTVGLANMASYWLTSCTFIKLGSHLLKRPDTT